MVSIQVQIEQRASKQYKGLKAENPQISLHEKARPLWWCGGGAGLNDYHKVASQIWGFLF